MVIKARTILEPHAWNRNLLDVQLLEQMRLRRAIVKGVVRSWGERFGIRILHNVSVGIAGVWFAPGTDTLLVSMRLFFFLPVLTHATNGRVITGIQQVHVGPIDDLGEVV